MNLCEQFYFSGKLSHLVTRLIRIIKKKTVYTSNLLKIHIGNHLQNAYNKYLLLKVCVIYLTVL